MTKFLFASASGAVLASLMPVCAQASNSNEEQGARQLDTVIVTAQKREENLQETPVSIIALGSAELETANVSDLVDLNTKLPNVTIAGAGGAGTNNASFSVRGLGSGSRNSPNTENSVGLYIDDAYFGKTDGAILDVVDVERIEVLRGPQGTLFGRNSTAGAIRYITKQPDLDSEEGRVEVTYGTFDRRDLRASFNLPLSDTVATRWSIASLNRDGYVQNALTGRDPGDQNLFAVRGAVLKEFSDRLSATLTLDYSQSDDNGAPTVASIANLTPNGGIWGAPFAATELAENLALYGVNQATVPTDDRFVSFAAGPHFSKRDSAGGNLVINYQVSDSVDFKSATTYRNLNTDVGYDMDGLPAELVGRVIDRNINVFTQEFQLTGATDTLDWVAGVFYLDESVTAVQDDFRMVNADNPNGIAGGQVVDPHETNSIAVFGQATYDLSDRFSVTGGLRYTADEKEQRVLQFAPGQSASDAVLVSDSSDDWSAVSGRLSGEFRVTEDVFLFASYSRGFRAGGLNDEGVSTPFPSFDEETIDAYEVGIRSDLLNDRLRANVTGFFMEATDLQFTALLDPNDNATQILNAGAAEISGIEAEFEAILTDHVSISLDVGLLDAEYTEVPPNQDSFVEIVAGDRPTHSPELSYNFALDFDVPLKSGAIEGNINYGYKDEYTLFPGISSTQESFGLLGFNLTYAPDQANWSASVFGTNVTDEEYSNIIMDIGGSIGGALGFRMFEPGRPAEYGVRLKYDF